ncbi:MAG: Cytokinin riboside 5-monophosphate phosphoribohydrolase [Candidatus Saccharibacteria bacterium]|nr:Cytokinin riboside 5-monophosphate phosphoribohydrolase [Candidatus Saccharibacteria bacterium]
MLDKPLSVPSLKSENEKNNLLVRQKIIDAAEGRLDTVTEEFEKAFDILSKYPKTITVFGTARLPQDDPVCQQAFAVAWALAKHDYAIVTGGGHGAMEAANRGAKQAGGASIGFNIHLPMEQKLNEYTTENLKFEHFFGRKVAMTLDASGYVYMPGGFGTFDELFEIITLIQTGIIPRVPVILMGVDYWTPLDKFINTTLVEKYQTVDPVDTELYTITDDIAVAVDVIRSHTSQEARKEMFDRAEKMEQKWLHARYENNKKAK